MHCILQVYYTRRQLMQTRKAPWHLPHSWVYTREVPWHLPHDWVHTSLVTQGTYSQTQAQLQTYSLIEHNSKMLPGTATHSIINISSSSSSYIILM